MHLTFALCAMAKALFVSVFILKTAKPAMVYLAKSRFGKSPADRRGFFDSRDDHDPARGVRLRGSLDGSRMPGWARQSARRMPLEKNIPLVFLAI